MALFKATTTLATSQLFPSGEGEEELWTAGKHQLKPDLLPRRVAEKGGDATGLRVGVQGSSGDTGNTQNVPQIKPKLIIQNG